MLRNQNGFTILETMIAALMATGIAYTSFSIFPFLRTQMATTRGSAACNSYLAQNFARIEVFGTAPRIIDNPPLPITNSATIPLHPAVYDASGLEMTPKYGQNLVSFVNSAQVTDIRTAGLYTSGVLLMNALYANRASICSSYIQFSSAALSSTTLLVPPPAELAKGFNIQMKIQPYDLANRQIFSGSDPCLNSAATQDGTIQVGPKGRRITGTEADSATPIVATMNHRNNVGYKVTLTANYIDVAAPRSCSQNRLVEYTGDVVPPTTPSGTVTPVAYVFSPTAAGPTSTDITFSFNGNKEGVVLMCRDQSTFAPPPVVAPKIPGSYAAGIPANNGAWLPCDRVSACGISPTLDATHPVWTALSPPSKKQFTITGTWNGTHKLLYGCTVQISVVAVDAAGNVSAPSLVSYALTDP